MAFMMAMMKAMELLILRPKSMKARPTVVIGEDQDGVDDPVG